MSINDFKEKINPVLESSRNLQYRASPFYTLILLVLVASIFFALGRISALNDQKTPLRVVDSSRQTAGVINSAVGIGPVSLESTGSTDLSGKVVGSKTGTKYYFPWCGTVKRIKPENLIEFSSIDEAKAKGYSPASNCPGLR